jgi:hypothetical protein
VQAFTSFFNILKELPLQVSFFQNLSREGFDMQEEKQYSQSEEWVPPKPLIDVYRKEGSQ